MVRLHRLDKPDRWSHAGPQEDVMSNDLVRLMGAVDYAARQHLSQRRKGERAEPYINHLTEVAALLAEATEGDDAVLLMGGLLHDTLEDTDATYEDIEQRFGTEVAALVAEVTDDKALPKEERKRLQIEKTPDSPGARNCSRSPTRPRISSLWCRARREGGPSSACATMSFGPRRWCVLVEASTAGSIRNSTMPFARHASASAPEEGAKFYDAARCDHGSMNAEGLIAIDAPPPLC
jgi:hypothetical protein